MERFDNYHKSLNIVVFIIIIWYYIVENRGINMKKGISARKLEERILIYILIFSSVLPLLIILENILVDYPFSANYKWFIFEAISLIMLYLILKDVYIYKIQLAFACFVIFFLLPLGWLTAGVSNNFTIAYSFLIYIAINLLFYNNTKKFLMVSEVLIVIVMIFLNTFYPALFFPVKNSTVFIDAIVQVIITFVFCGLLLGVFTNEYKREQKMLEEYAVLLDLQNKALEKLTMIDDLTQLYNRRYLFNYFHNHTQTSNNRLLIGMVDIDEFKDINDTYGHDLGDQVIKFVSNELKNIIGDHGIVGRYGGDEFLIIFETLDYDTYYPIIKEINKINVKLDSLNHSVTLSGGFVFYDGSDSIDEALYRADALLYHVKDNGKNNMIIE